MNFSKNIKRFFHWETPKKPKIDLNTELYTELKPFRLPLILTVLLIMFGSLGYVIIDDFALMDAIYQTGITFTTVGFGEMSPISTAGRLFTITLIILGFGVFSFSIGILVESMNKGNLLGILKERNMLYRIARLKNHFVVCHHNDYTVHLARQFRENHIPFVVIDPSENLEEEAKKHKYPYHIQAEPHTETALLKSNLSSAKGVITLSKNIADNIAQIASVRLYEKEIGKRRPYYVMAHASNQSDTDKLKKLGADNVVSPSKLMAQRISAMSIRPDMHNLLEEFLYKKDTPLDIEEITIPDYSWMRLKKIKEAHLRKTIKVSIVGIRDSLDKFIPMPKGDTLISSGSKLLLIGTSDNIREAKRIIRKKYKPEELKYV